MMRFLHEAGLLLLPFCGWLAGDLVQSRRNERLDALQQTIALLQRIRQEIQDRRADLQALYRQLCREGILPETAATLQQTPALSAALTPEEQRCFRECMDGLGRTEAVQEGERLQYYIARFEGFRQQAGQEEATRAGLPHKLGLAAGAALALALW